MNLKFKKYKIKFIKLMLKFLYLILIILINFNDAHLQDGGRKFLSVEKLLIFKKNAELNYNTKTGKPKKWGSHQIPIVFEQQESVIFEDNFNNLNNWHHEGIGQLTQPDSNMMQLNCVGSGQGKLGCMAFCKKDFPDNICIEYDLKVLTTEGLIITFIACQGRNGEDMITELPERKGSFADYVFNEKQKFYKKRDRILSIIGKFLDEPKIPRLKHLKILLKTTIH